MTVKKKTRRFRRAGRGSVVLIALLLVSSGILRISSGVANAADTAAPVLPKPLPDAVASEAMSARAIPTKMAKPDRAEMGSLLEALNAREESLRERERQIELRSKAISVANAEISKRIAMLEEAEAALRGTLSIADVAAEDDLTRLTTVYESMKPKEAAALFETMEPDFAAGFLGRMRPDLAAGVMAGLSPDMAYSISVILAGRNALAPKN